MEVNNKQIKYSINLAAGENIKILINDIPAFNETVGTGFECGIDFKYTEQRIIE